MPSPSACIPRWFLYANLVALSASYFIRDISCATFVSSSRFANKREVSFAFVTPQWVGSLKHLFQAPPIFFSIILILRTPIATSLIPIRFVSSPELVYSHRNPSVWSVNRSIPISVLLSLQTPVETASPLNFCPYCEHCIFITNLLTYPATIFQSGSTREHNITLKRISRNKLLT